MYSLHSALCLCIVLGLLQRLQAYPLNLQKSLKSSQQSTWFDLFDPADGSIQQDVLETFPLYEYVYADYEYGDQIWSDCGSSSDLVMIDTVYVNPSPPQRGESFSVTATITLNKKISSGSVKILIKYKSYIPVVVKTMDLCTLLSYLGVSCPLSAGTHELSTSQTFPSYAPAGRYVGKIVGQDDYGNQLACVAIDMTVS